MSDQTIRFIDELDAEFARVAAAHTHRSGRMLLAPSRLPSFAAALVLLVLAGAGAYAVPVTRGAMEGIGDTFAGWVAGDDAAAPGQSLRPDDDAPPWVRERGGRLIAKTESVGLYVSRVDTQERGTQLTFSLDDGTEVSDTIEGWRGRFRDHALIVLGPGPDTGGRLPLLGVTARSVERVELQYATARKKTIADDLSGGFVLLADADSPVRELVAYDAEGRELERTDMSYLNADR
jgi:hypothetical protein